MTEDRRLSTEGINASTRVTRRLGTCLFAACGRREKQGVF